MWLTSVPLGVALAAGLLAGCATNEWVARDAFGDKYSCPADRVTVRKEVPATTPDGQPLPGFTDLAVGGCGVESKYLCHNSAAGTGSTKNVCVENLRFGIQASDGSVVIATTGGPDAAGAPEKAALASAAHDIPCARASLQVVGREPMVIDGCGQRLMYREEEHDLVPPPGYTLDGDIKGYREVLISRTPLADAGPPQPEPPTATSAAPTQAPSPAPSP